VSGDRFETGTIEWGDGFTERIFFTTGLTVSPICHHYVTDNEQTVQLTTSGQIYYLDFSGQQLTHFFQGNITGIVYLGLANVKLSTGLSGVNLSGLEHLHYLVISHNGLSIEQYNTFLDTISKQNLPNAVHLYATPYQYGGCNIANNDIGITGRKKLTLDKKRIIIDSGSVDCTPIPPPTN
jgi:hypothetical protein